MVRGHSAWQRTDSQMEGIILMSELLRGIPLALLRDCEGPLLTLDLLKEIVSALHRCHNLSNELIQNTSINHDAHQTVTEGHSSVFCYEIIQ
jgi:hypothetical protein